MTSEFDRFGRNEPPARPYANAERVIAARLRLVQFAASHSLDEVLQATLDEAEALTGSTIGFYHFLNADQRTLSLQMWSTNTLKSMCAAEGKGSHYDVSAAGVWVDCIHERRPVIHNDYRALKHRKGLPEGHAPVDRELVVPVFRGGDIVAILGVGNKPRPYDEKDVETVSLMADLAWDIAEVKKKGRSAAAIGGAVRKRRRYRGHRHIHHQSGHENSVPQPADEGVVPSGSDCRLSPLLPRI